MLKRILFPFMILSALCAQALAQGNPNVRVTWIGQSGFLVQTDGGPAVISDPPPANFGFIFPTNPVEAVTVSHTHADHAGTTQAQGSPALIDGRNVTARGTMAAASTTFTIIPGFHDTGGATRNSLITWTQGGLKFMQGGDYGQSTLTAEQLADLGNIDVAFIAATTPTYTPAQAKAFVDQLGARVTILCHYRTALGGAAQLGGFREISAPYTGLVFKPSAVTINKDTLPAAREVWVMQPAANAVVVNSASFANGAPVGPGSLASVFGTFTGAMSAAAAAFPLPTTLGNVEVLVGGAAAPLLFASAGQINFQVPGKINTPGQALVEVKVGGATVGRAQVTTVLGAPGVYAATSANFIRNGPANPANAGQTLILWASGHGELAEIPADGQPATAISTKTLPRVTIGGVEAQVLYSGLAPGLAGVWQINITVPLNAPEGNNVPLVVTQGQASVAFPLAVAASIEEPEAGGLTAMLRRMLNRVTGI